MQFGRWAQALHSSVLAKPLSSIDRICGTTLAELLCWLELRVENIAHKKSGLSKLASPRLNSFATIGRGVQGNASRVD